MIVCFYLQQLFYGRYTDQLVSAGTPDKSWRMLFKQSFMASMVLQTYHIKEKTLALTSAVLRVLSLYSIAFVPWGTKNSS